MLLLLLRESNCDDGGDAGRACVEAFDEIRLGDPADGQHRNGNGSADLGEACQALRRTEGSLGRSGENRTEEDIVGAFAFCGYREFQGVTGFSDEQATADLIGFQPLQGIGQRGFFAELDAERPCCQDGVKAVVVHEDTGELPTFPIKSARRNKSTAR